MAGRKLRVDHCGGYEDPELRKLKRLEKGLKVDDEEEETVDAKGFLMRHLTGEAARGAIVNRCVSVKQMMDCFVLLQRRSCGSRRSERLPRRPRKTERRANENTNVSASWC